MEMKDSALFMRNSDNWSTPQNLFDRLNAEFHFDLDPCADETNHKCEKFFDMATDGLSQSWGGTQFSAIHRIPKLANGYGKLTKSFTSSEAEPW